MIRERALVEQLREETKHLRAAIDQVGMTLTEIAATASLRSSIEGCEVESPAASLLITPSDPQQTMQAGATKRFAVSGGSGVPRAAFIGDTIKGAELKPSIQNGMAVFDLETTKEGGPGTLGVAFSDATGQARTVVTVTVETSE